MDTKGRAMALARYGNKRDANEPEIFVVLRMLGFTIYPLDTPVDALVGYAGKSHLIEIKNGPAPYTKTQKDFQAGWQGCYTTLRSVSEARAWGKSVIEGARIKP
jgi:hypothetical protein